MPLVIFSLLCLSACPKDGGDIKQSGSGAVPAPPESSGVDTSISAETSSASPAKEEKPSRMAISPEGKKIKVQRLKSGNTLYRGIYSELDKWIYNNYNPGEEDLAIKGKGVGKGETLRALYVTKDGFIIPNLEALKYKLNQRTKGQSPGSKPGPYAFYAIGVLPDKIRDENLAARAALTAEYMPPIPMWLSKDPPYWALILPDGSVVFKGKLGEGKAFFPRMENRHILDGLKVSHYSDQGMFIEQTEPGQLWCELFFDGFEDALKRHGIGRDNVGEYGYYLQFLNMIEQTKTGYYYYDGTPISDSEIRTTPDYNRLFEMNGKHIPQMYIRQQEGKH